MLETWSTYRLSDFLLFSRETYWRLFELMNEAVWPAQIVVVAAALAVLWLAFRPPPRAGRVIAFLLAVAWAWVAWGFHFERYAPINLAAPYFAAAFALQAELLLVATAVGVDLRDAAGLRRGVALGLLGSAIVLQPLLGPAAGRPWSGVGLAGLAPDPTAIATLGVVLLAGRRWRWLLLPVPLAWCAVSGATAWGLDAPEGLVMPVAAILALAAATAPGAARPPGA